MKISKFYSLLIILFISTVMVRCSDDDSPSLRTIADIVIDSENFTLLEKALVRTNLINTFQETGTYTVFAPNDAAFTQALVEIGVASIDDIPIDVLTALLQNHVLSNRLEATDLTSGYVKTIGTNSDADFIDAYIHVDGAVVKINDGAEVENADILASNGVIHEIDEVISVSTIGTLIDANSDFSILISALEQEKLISLLISPSSLGTPFTVFAPTNDAFDALFGETNANNISDLLDIGDRDISNTSDLDEILRYHIIINQMLRDDDLSDDDVLTTWQGETLTINRSSDDTITVTEANDRVISVQTTDVTGSNGVIHIISNVLIPGSVG